MMPTKCIFCDNSRITLLETLHAKDINAIYEKSFNIREAIKADALDYYRCESCGIRFFYPLETGGEELYESLQAFDWYYMSDKPEYEIAQGYIKQDASVLEVGAGRAAFARYANLERYVGLEYNQRAIERAESAGVRLIKESIEEHASKNNLYDVVVSFQVLEHVSDPAGFLNGCMSCLKPGGMLIISVPSHDSIFGQAINNVLDIPPHHVSHWSDDTLKKISQLFRINLIAIQHEHITDYHRNAARKIIFESGINRFLTTKHSLLDLSWTGKIVSVIATMLAKLIPIQLDRHMGHTVVAVYSKDE